MNRLLWILGIVIVLIGGALLAFRAFERPIAERLFERGFTANIAADPLADLDDGIHVFMCGSGSPMPDVVRAGPCVGVLAGDQRLIFDSGSGSVRNLSRMGMPLGLIDQAFLTHLHSDHMDGLGELLLQRWIGASNTSPLPIIGPVGTAQVVAGFNMAYQLDSTYRIEHHTEVVAPPSGFGGVAQEITVPEGTLVVYENGGVTVTAFPVDHAPVEPAVGFRVDYADRSVVISGDTVYDPRLVEASKGADLLLHEALQPTMVKTMADAASDAGRANIAKIFNDILDYHASPEDAARAAREAGVDDLVLYHIVPPLPSDLLIPAFMGDAASEFDGPITVAKDGLLISLPKGSDTITYEHRF